MSTKNLSRTLMEGGNRKDWNDNCRRATRLERHGWNRQCRNLEQDPQAWDQTTIKPRDPGSHWYSGRCDHWTNVLSRFLENRVGRDWDAVYSELCHTFSRRSWRGWMVIDNKIRWLIGHEDISSTSHRTFIVGRDNILRRNSDYEWYFARQGRRTLQPPASWPMNKDIFSSLDLLLGLHVKPIYFVTIHGQFYWVKAQDWYVETINVRGELREHFWPVSFKLWRCLTDEELGYLQSLRGHDYKSLRLREARSQRQFENFMRRNKNVPMLPDVNIENLDQAALQAA